MNISAIKLFKNVVILIKIRYNSRELKRQSLVYNQRKVRAAQGTVVANGDRS